MKAKGDGWNIVLAGTWNRAIFSPEWVSQYVFGNVDEIETLLAFMPSLPLIYRTPKVSLEVSQQRLLFRPRVLDDECLSSVEQMANAVLRKLQDTPLLAVGVNFAFIESTPPPELLRLFDFADDADTGGAGWEIQSRKIVKRIKSGEDVLNLAMTLTETSVEFDMNFHTDTVSNEVAQRETNGRMLRLRGMATQLLQQVYHLDLELAGAEGNG